jgi:hypothetical protein
LSRIFSCQAELFLRSIPRNERPFAITTDRPIKFSRIFQVFHAVAEARDFGGKLLDSRDEFSFLGLTHTHSSSASQDTPQ